MICMFVWIFIVIALKCYYLRAIGDLSFKEVVINRLGLIFLKIKNDKVRLRGVFIVGVHFIGLENC